MLCATPEPQVSQTLYYIAPFVATSSSSLCCCMFDSSSSSSLSIFIFIYVLYIWSKKYLLNVEFLINKTPSNTDMLPKTTRYHHRFWNICQNFFILCMLWLFTWSMHALFVLAIYTIYAYPNFLFIYLFLPQNKYYSSSKNLTNLLYFSFLFWLSPFFFFFFLVDEKIWGK